MRLGFKRSLIVGVAVLVLLAVLAPAAMAYPVHVWGECHGKFYGGVRDLTGATVTVDNPVNPAVPFATTTSGPDGMFDMWADLVAPTYSGTCNVSATMIDFNDAHLLGVPFSDNGIDIGAAGATEAVLLDLVVTNTKVTGTVKNAATRKPLRGVSVKLGNKTVKTNAKGKYTILIGLWPATKYKIKFSKKGFHAQTKSVLSHPNLGRTVNVSLRPS